MVDDSNKGLWRRRPFGGKRRIFQKLERGEQPDWPERETLSDKLEFDDDSSVEVSRNDENEWSGESRVLGVGDGTVKDRPQQERVYDLNAEDFADTLSLGSVDSTHQAMSQTGMGQDQGWSTEDPALTMPELSTDLQHPTLLRQRRFLLSMSAVVVIGLLVGSYFWGEQKRPVSEPSLVPISAEPVFEDPAVSEEPYLTEQVFVDEAALEEQRIERLRFAAQLRLKSTAQRRLSDPKVAAVFYAIDHTTDDVEQVIQSLDVTDLKRVYRSADQLRGALHPKSESLSEPEKKRLAEAVLDDAILDFGAEPAPYSNQSSIDAEIDRRIERIAAAVQSNRDFEQWVSVHYGSRAAFRNKVERGIVRQEYLARKSLSKQEAAKMLRESLEIMWADSP